MAGPGKIPPTESRNGKRGSNVLVWKLSLIYGNLDLGIRTGSASCLSHMNSTSKLNAATWFQSHACSFLLYVMYVVILVVIYVQHFHDMCKHIKTLTYTQTHAQTDTLTDTQGYCLSNTGCIYELFSGVEFRFPKVFPVNLCIYDKCKGVYTMVLEMPFWNAKKCGLYTSNLPTSTNRATHKAFLSLAIWDGKLIPKVLCTLVLIVGIKTSF